jgi:hypothetical protein
MSTMISLKGVLLGLIGFAVFSIAYFFAVFPFSSHGASTMGLSVITRNPYYWTMGALMVALGCLIVAIWPVRAM